MVYVVTPEGLARFRLLGCLSLLMLLAMVVQWVFACLSAGATGITWAMLAALASSTAAGLSVIVTFFYANGLLKSGLAPNPSKMPGE